jgi:hypothetical protein
MARGYVTFEIADVIGSALFSREAPHRSAIADAT